MTQFNPERVMGHISHALYDAYANHDYANGSVWEAMSKAAIEAAHYAELVEALSMARDELVEFERSTTVFVSDEHTPHTRSAAILRSEELMDKVRKCNSVLINIDGDR